MLELQIRDLTESGLGPIQTQSYFWPQSVLWSVSNLCISVVGLPGCFGLVHEKLHNQEKADNISLYICMQKPQA